MRMPLYEEHETDISRRNLPAVLSEAHEPACLLGGWAVHATVDARSGGGGRGSP